MAEDCVACVEVHVSGYTLIRGLLHTSSLPPDIAALTCFSTPFMTIHDSINIKQKKKKKGIILYRTDETYFDNYSNIWSVYILNEY